MAKHLILVVHWLPDGVLTRWESEFFDCEFIPAEDLQRASRELPFVSIAYGLPDAQWIRAATSLRWIQLGSAGVPAWLCPISTELKLRVTNLAGLYGPTIAEHALALMLTLSRNLHVAQRNQLEKKWDRTVAHTMRDLHGKTVAIFGLGNIGQNVARLAKAHGMRVVGCRRTARPTPFTDQVYDRSDLKQMLAEADYVVVAAPSTSATDGCLGPAEFQAMRQSAFFVNVSRGSIAQEPALAEALRSGHLAGAGLDVFAAEPLPPEHPLWTLPNVVISPHYSGETVNTSSLPSERFARNLRNWLGGRDLEGNVDVRLGY